MSKPLIDGTNQGYDPVEILMDREGTIARPNCAGDRFWSLWATQQPSAAGL